MKQLLKKIFSEKFRRLIFSTINRLWCAFCYHLPVKNRVLFYTIRCNGALDGNAKAVFDALDGKKIIYAHKLPHSKLNKAIAYYYIITSKKIITDDFCRYLPNINLREGQRVIQLWHACGAFKKFGLDDENSIFSPEIQKAYHEKYDAVTVSSPHCSEIYAKAFGIDKAKCLPVGVARTDEIINNLPEIKANALKKHPEIENKKIYLYCPTFREENGKITRFNPGIDFERLNNELSEDEIFIIRRHPLMNEPLFSEKFDKIIDLSAGNDSTIELCSVAAVLITDYSSVIYEAALMNTPCLFYCPDLEKYERGFYLNFPEDLPGKIITDAGDIVTSVRTINQNEEFCKKLASFKEKELSACDGKSTERIVELVRKSIGTQPISAPFGGAVRRTEGEY